MTLHAKVIPLIERWLQWDEDPETRTQIEHLRDAGNWEELDRRLANDIQFGTAGLRGKMQAGFAAMNSVTVCSASQGIASYMVETMEHNHPSDLSVLIGYDTRHNSARFARVAATAFASKGIKVLLYEQYVPTPFVSFGVGHFKANAGVMITASHNPKADNGYKVYWSNGCQINTPIDREIAAAIRKQQKPWPGAFKPHLSESPDGTNPLRDEVMEAYIARLRAVCQHKEITHQDHSRAPAAFLYTPMHGVGYFVMESIARDVFDVGFVVVGEQKDPNPEFPTVAFPNPEEPGALDLALSTAEGNQCSTIIANDPDADRLAVAERVGSHSWHKFTGDQLGVLLASYVLEKEAVEGSLDQPVAMLSSAVSSGMLKKMVAAAGQRFHHEETLTGFKWIGNRAKDLTGKGFKVIFSYEEALGYMFPEVSFDKDGLAAAAVYLEARDYWKAQGSSPYEKLMQIYDSIGYHESINTYFKSPSPLITRDFFDQVRSVMGSVAKLGDMPFVKWRDVTNNRLAGKWDSQLHDEASQMITCVVIPDESALDCKVTFTLRGSGTEPKLKLYLEAESADKSVATAHAVRVLSLIVSEWVKIFAPSLSYSRTVETSSGRSVMIE